MKLETPCLLMVVVVLTLLWLGLKEPLVFWTESALVWLGVGAGSCQGIAIAFVHLAFTIPCLAIVITRPAFQTGG